MRLLRHTAEKLARRRSHLVSLAGTRNVHNVGVNNLARCRVLALVCPGIQAASMDHDAPDVFDYVYFKGSATPVGSRIWANQPHVNDATLFASDHVGVVADFDIQPAE